VSLFACFAPLVNPLRHADNPQSDQVSDAILDACLAEDPLSKVACETATKTGMFIISEPRPIF